MNIKKRYIKTSIESQEGDGRFIVEGFYGANYSGLAHSFSTDDFDAAADAAHDFLSDGDFVEITDTVTGHSERLDYDSYFDGFDGEFPLSVIDFDPNYFD